MRHLNFPKAQPPYNPEEWAGVNPRYSHLLEVPTPLPLSSGRSRLVRAAGTT